MSAKVIWVDGKILFKSGSSRKAFYGICGYSKKCFTIQDTILPILVVQDIYTESPHGCEEGTRCLVFECPLNRTTRETYAKSIGVKIAKLPAKFGTPMSINQDQGIKKYFEELINDNQPGTVITKKGGKND